MRGLMWLSVCCVSCTELDLAPQQPFKGDVSYWSVGVNAELVDEAAAHMAVMGWRFTRVPKRAHADITVEPFTCSDPDVMARTLPCGQVLFCRGHAQRSGVFSHEFGHALGADHIEGGPAVMNARSEIDDFTTLDVVAFKRSDFGLTIFKCEEETALGTK